MDDACQSEKRRFWASVSGQQLDAGSVLGRVVITKKDEVATVLDTPGQSGCGRGEFFIPGAPATIDGFDQDADATRRRQEQGFAL